MAVGEGVGDGWRWAVWCDVYCLFHVVLVQRVPQEIQSFNADKSVRCTVPWNIPSAVTMILAELSFAPERFNPDLQPVLLRLIKS